MTKESPGPFVGLLLASITSAESEEAMYKTLHAQLSVVGKTFTADELDKIDQARSDRSAEFGRMRMMQVVSLNERFKNFRAVLQDKAA